MKKIIIIFIIFLLCLSLYYIGTNYYIPCIFKKITGLYCPGCGVTRMFRSLLNLEIYQAFRYNPLIFILLIIFSLYGIYYVICILFNRKVIKINNRVWYSILIVTLLFTILRNISIFSFLAPTIVK